MFENATLSECLELVKKQDEQNADPNTKVYMGLSYIANQTEKSIFDEMVEFCNEYVEALRDHSNIPKLYDHLKELAPKLNQEQSRLHYESSILQINNPEATMEEKMEGHRMLSRIINSVFSGLLDEWFRNISSADENQMRIFESNIKAIPGVMNQEEEIFI